MDPPQCIQNAMMTKDKKPFTYTPGGIDLSEVRSPRMQRRIERNATLGSPNDVPRPPPPPVHAGPLPPAALAALTPQPQVQVFPGPPPPPPMKKHIPPPPPPPSCPLPTQKVTVKDEVIERPDMTKIIPENPMALLRRTGGPTSRPTMLNEAFKETNDSFPSPPSPQKNAYDQSPRYYPRSEQPSAAHVQANQPHEHQQYRPSPSPQIEYQQPIYQPPPLQNQQIPQRSTESPRPVYQPPIIKRQTPSNESNKNSSVGSLYIPSRNQQQHQVTSPSTHPERNHNQSPATPPLREAPRPWQQRSPQHQQELPPWVKKDEDVSNQSPPPAPNMQQRWQPNPNSVPSPQVQSSPSNQDHSPRTIPAKQRQPEMQSQPQYPSNDSFPVHIEIRTRGFPMEPMQPDERKPNAVYVTQPIVLQHPGPEIDPPYPVQVRPQPQMQNGPKPQVQPRPTVNCSGTRIIPIQMEATPTEERNLDQQSSWGQPTQSNSFKAIQRFTNTADGGDTTPMTQHSARYTQEMPAQMRQGNGQPQQYVHPSEQVVPEPKKYMGGNIPGRTFKILQAMTNSPNNCANAKNYEEPTPNTPINNPNSYPFYPPPYWPNFYTNHVSQKQSESLNKPKKSRELSSPLPYEQPFWPDFYQQDHLLRESESISKMSDRSSRSSTNKSGRSTPLPIRSTMPYPFYGYMPPPPPPPYTRPRSTTPIYDNRPQIPVHKGDEEDPAYMYQMYPPYFDPYYYSYYYGYMPMIPPYPYYPQTPDNEEYSGYSSTDEMSAHNNDNDQSEQKYHLHDSINSVQSLAESFENRCKSTAPSITITPTDSKELIFCASPKREEYEMINYREMSQNPDTDVEVGIKQNKLHSIKSVPNINVYDRGSDEHTDSSDSEDSSHDDDYEEVSVQQDSEPDQLSVIYEESDRGFSRATLRSDTSCSEDTISDNRNNEDQEDFLSKQNVKYKIKLFQESLETLSTDSTDERQLQKIEKMSRDNSSFKNNPNKMHHDTITNDFGNGIEDQKTPSNHFWKKQQNNNSRNHIEDNSRDEKYDFCRMEKENVSNRMKNMEEEVGCIQNNPCYPTPNQIQNDLEACEQIAENTLLVNNESATRKTWENIEIFGEIKEKIGFSTNSNNYYNDEVMSKDFSEKCHVSQNCEKDDTFSNASSTTIVEAHDQNVSVMLRQKKDVMKDNKEKPESLDTAKINAVSLKSELEQDTVYDVLRTSIDDSVSERISGGILMKVDSFATQLENIKRDSGLWTFTLDTSHKEEDSSDESENEDNHEDTEEGGEETEAEEEKKSLEEVVTYQHLTSESNDSSSDDEKTEETYKVHVRGDECVQDKAVNENDHNSESSQDIDFWSQIRNDDDDFTPRKKSIFLEDKSKEEVEKVNEKEEEETLVEIREQLLDNVENDNDSTSSKNSSYSGSLANHSPNPLQDKYAELNEKIESSNIANNCEVTCTSNPSYSEQETADIDGFKSMEPEIKPLSIKERIEALTNRQQHKKHEKEEIMHGKRHIMEIPIDSRNTSTKSSLKSFEEYSEEEELDSGVISDISRHISDNEEFPELRKLTRYERAATHSRLFKLLQDECDIEENKISESIQKEDKFSKLSVRRNRKTNEIVNSRSRLSLALDESYGKHDINEKLVEELVESLLRSKKAQIFKNMSKEKLYAAAVTILQEGTDISPEEFSSLISPLRGETGSSTAAQTPQEFYSDENGYKQYYDSWRDAAVEIIPSKAFKQLQDHLESQKLGSIEGFLAKCPRILSSKNIPQEIMKIIDNSGSDCLTNLSLNIPQSNDVANT